MAVLLVGSPAGAAPSTMTSRVSPVDIDPMPLTVVPVKGTEAVSIEGKAPPMALVVLTLRATISKDLPDVYLNEREVTADADGNFGAIVGIAADFWRGSIVTVTASSPAMVSHPNARIRVRLPNPGVVLPADDVPNH